MWRNTRKSVRCKKLKTILELQNIAKQYKGKKVLEKTSFFVCANQIVALVGKNGSGKSTLLKIIAGLENPDAGEIIKHIHPLKIGYVPEVTPYEIPFTPIEYLTHMGNVRGMDKNELKNRIEILLDIFHLQDVRMTRMAEFSKGMKQKVIIMQAILEKASLLILDEPLSGLDPKTKSELEGILLALKDNGLSILLTCHETNLLERLVDRVLLIKNHHVVQSNVLNEIANPRDRVTFEISPQQLSAEFLTLIEIQQENRLTSEVNEIVAIVKRENTDTVLLELLKRGASIKKLSPINLVELEFYN